MAEFEKAFKQVIQNEGGYVNDPDDAGGETYKGIARNRNGAWRGWISVDLLKRQSNFPQNLNNDQDLQVEVMELYHCEYWHRVRGDQIKQQAIAESIFDFAVNAGVVMSSRLAQLSCNAEVDGVIGNKTLEALNTISTELFIPRFSLAKIARYINICKRIPKNRKYFYGWVNRTLEGV